MNRCLLLLLVTIFFLQRSSAQQTSENSPSFIRLNQIGFYPDGPKIAVILGGNDSVFYIQTPGKKIVFKGELKWSVKPDFAGNKTLIERRRPGNHLKIIVKSKHGFSFQLDIGKAGQ